MHVVRVVLTGAVVLAGVWAVTARPRLSDHKSPAVGQAKSAFAESVDSAGLAVPVDPSSPVATYVDSKKVAEAFAKGAMLYRWSEDGQDYRVQIARHFKGENAPAGQMGANGHFSPDVVEVHGLREHIIYVLQGSATFLTGGTVVNSKTSAPNETRGTSIEGGETHHLSKGDVMIVPRGVPYWVKEVQSPFITLGVNVP